MVDIGSKDATKREAVVEARMSLAPETIGLIRKSKVPKGDCLEAARLAGIIAAKKTPFLIPLCHPIPIESVEVDFSLGVKDIIITTKVRAEAKTGVEMEALTAASIAALTIYDMCKPMDKGIVIGPIMLMKKTGGKSGAYVRK